jgi:hypothetical protein
MNPSGSLSRDPPSVAPPALHRSAPVVQLRGPGPLWLLRGAEFPPDNMPFLPLWVELYRESVRVVVDACGFSELEDTVEAVQELVEKAKRLRGAW